MRKLIGLIFLFCFISVPVSQAVTASQLGTCVVYDKLEDGKIKKYFLKDYAKDKCSKLNSEYSFTKWVEIRDLNAVQYGIAGVSEKGSCDTRSCAGEGADCMTGLPVCVCINYPRTCE